MVKKRTAEELANVIEELQRMSEWAIVHHNIVLEQRMNNAVIAKLKEVAKEIAKDED